jgi:arginyl-tRNA synthetase
MESRRGRDGSIRHHPRQRALRAIRYNAAPPHHLPTTMNLRDHLNTAVEQAMRACDIPADCQALVTQGTRPGFGDYQANGAMGAAKRMGTNPRELAGRIVAALELQGVAERVEVAGPGFINIHLAREFLEARIAAVGTDPRFGIAPLDHPQTVVVDYSAPNLAKEMHVGHLRSTIIGDAVVRALEFRGDRVIRQNHVGDWGTQFGMLIAQLEDTPGAAEGKVLADIEDFYRAAKQRFDAEPAFAGRAREYVVRLQGGDVHCLALWQRFIDISAAHSEEIYRKLNVTLRHADLKGESCYNDDLPVVIDELRAKGLLSDSEGARVVFLDEMRDREGNPQAVIVQKADGGYLYATTDLAAARHRARDLHADRVLYFIDDRQKLHMQQVFAIARRAGFVPESTTLEHHPFGKMLGEDGKPFKTRAGGTIKLAELLDEAIERAGGLLASRETGFDEAERAIIARAVGIGAVKYADLSKNRTSDYVFSWDHMLSFEGNTAPYLQYACTRAASLFRKAGRDLQSIGAGIALETAEERALALKILQFGEALTTITHDCSPHLLCAWLYDLAGLFMRFYESCPVLREDVPEATRESRLALARLGAGMLRQGLDLLGIEVPERM